MQDNDDQKVEIPADIKAIQEIREKNLRELEQKSILGEKMKIAWDVAYDILKAQIFDPIRQDTLNILERTDFHVEEHGQLYELQAMLRAVTQIEKRWAKKIVDGANARIEISQGTTPQEGV